MRDFLNNGDDVMALVFLDLDGTTLDRGRPAFGIIETIAELKQKGHRPVIATGRVPHLLYGIEKILGIEDYIAANGNFIKYNGEVVYQRFISKETVQKMVDYCDRLGIDLVLEGLYDYIALSKKTSMVDDFSEIFNIEFPRIDREYHLKNDVLSMVFFDDTKIEEVRKLFPELVFNRSNRFGYDVNPQGNLKADGINWLVEYLDYPKEDIYAIGDGMNDITMLKAVAHGIAMGNSYPELKTIAHHITDNVDQEGVRKALKHYGLI
jgi:Cof subfamily protein (haloacid dehalogenase superfamily)